MNRRRFLALGLVPLVPLLAPEAAAEHYGAKIVGTVKIWYKGEIIFSAEHATAAQVGALRVFAMSLTGKHTNFRFKNFSDYKYRRSQTQIKSAANESVRRLIGAT